MLQDIECCESHEMEETTTVATDGTTVTTDSTTHIADDTTLGGDDTTSKQTTKKSQGNKADTTHGYTSTTTESYTSSTTDIPTTTSIPRVTMPLRKLWRMKQ